MSLASYRSRRQMAAPNDLVTRPWLQTFCFRVFSTHGASRALYSSEFQVRVTFLCRNYVTFPVWTSRRFVTLISKLHWSPHYTSHGKHSCHFCVLSIESFLTTAVHVPRTVTLQSGHHWRGHRRVEEATSGMSWQLLQLMLCCVNNFCARL